MFRVEKTPATYVVNITGMTPQEAGIAAAIVYAVDGGTDIGTRTMLQHMREAFAVAGITPNDVPNVKIEGRLKLTVG